MIKKCLKVKIISGKDKNKDGEIIEIDRQNYRAKVKGINMVKNGIEIMLGLGGEEIESYIGGWEKEGGILKSAKQFTELDELLNAFRKELKPGDVVLVKGSRSAHMERFVENIRWS